MKEFGVAAGKFFFVGDGDNLPIGLLHIGDNPLEAGLVTAFGEFFGL